MSVPLVQTVDGRNDVPSRWCALHHQHIHERLCQKLADPGLLATTLMEVRDEPHRSMTHDHGGPSGDIPQCSGQRLADRPLLIHLINGQDTSHHRTPLDVVSLPHRGTDQRAAPEFPNVWLSVRGVQLLDSCRKLKT